MWNLALTLLLGSAAAQQPATFSLDPVFVSRFQPAAPDLDPQAKEIRTLLEEQLGRSFLLLGRDEIPDFEDYSAETYLAACPAAEHLGCAFVIGEKGAAEWVVTGRVEAGNRVTVAFIDVNDSRVVFDFAVDLDDTSQEEFAGAVTEVLNQIIAGSAAETDLRQDSVTDAERRQREDEQRQLLAKSLEGIDAELETLERSLADKLEDPKLTRSDLEQFRERDDATPWERLGMSEAEFVRFRNSGDKLADWRLKMRGRAARLVVSLGAGPASGPWSQEFDGRKALSAQTLTPVEVFEYQELDNGPGIVGELDVGFGVHKWVQVGGYMAFRSSTYSYLVHSEVEGQPAPVDEPIAKRISTIQFGARADFVPMSTWPFRPTGTFGVGSWRGVAFQDLFALPTDNSLQPLEKPSLVLVEIGPGAELDLGPQVTVFGRVLMAIPVAGNEYQEYRTGAPLLSSRPEPDASWGAGVQATAGVRIRLGPLFGNGPVRPSLGDDEFEEEEPEEELD